MKCVRVKIKPLQRIKTPLQLPSFCHFLMSLFDQNKNEEKSASQRLNWIAGKSSQIIDYNLLIICQNSQPLIN